MEAAVDDRPPRKQRRSSALSKIRRNKGEGTVAAKEDATRGADWSGPSGIRASELCTVSRQEEGRQQ